jgi:hypothetical protein
MTMKKIWVVLLYGFVPVAAILSILVGLVIRATEVEGKQSFRSAITSRNVKDDITIEKYCGYLTSVGHGSVTFEDGTVFENAYLLFDNGEGKSRSVRILYGDAGRIKAITSGRYYEIAVRRYDDGSGFPQTIKIVEGCK